MDSSRLAVTGLSRVTSAPRFVLNTLITIARSKATGNVACVSGLTGAPCEQYSLGGKLHQIARRMDGDIRDRLEHPGGSATALRDDREHI